MPYIQRMASSLTGAEGPEDGFAKVIIRSHPKLEHPKQLDVLPAELEPLKSAGDIVTLEIRNPDTTTRDLHVRLADFAKWCSDEVLNAAHGTKGRPTGYSPKNNGHHS